MKKLLILVLLGISALASAAAPAARGGACQRDDAFPDSQAGGNLLVCDNGKFEYLQIIQFRELTTQLAQIQLDIAPLVVNRAATTPSYSQTK